MKKRKPKFEFISKYMLFILTTVFILIIAVSFIREDAMNPVKNAVGQLLSPLQSGLNQTGRTLIQAVSGIWELKDAQRENEELKQKIAELEEENNLSAQDREELKTLRELYELDGNYSQYEKVGAKVIGKDSGNWFHYFLIDKGYEDGIRESANVIADGGLVGIVTEVGATTSKVLSIIDDSSNVTAMTPEGQDGCMVSGDLTLYEEGVLRVMYVDKDASITSGDKLVTSNTSSKYLPGILIGYVKDLEMDPNNLSKTGTLIPVVDFSHLDTVLVITDLKENWEDFEEYTEPEETTGEQESAADGQTGENAETSESTQAEQP